MADLKVACGAAPPITYCGWPIFLGSLACLASRFFVKSYGVLFIYMASRAIHIEVADSLETDFFIQAPRRFICRRGPVKKLHRHRGKNFIVAETELNRANEEMNDKMIKADLLQAKIY